NKACADFHDGNGEDDDTDCANQGLAVPEETVQVGAETVQSAPQTVKSASPEPLNEPFKERIVQQELATARADDGQNSTTRKEEGNKKNAKGRNHPSLLGGTLNEDIKAEVFKIFDQANRKRPGDIWLVDTWVEWCSTPEWAERGWTI